MDKKERGRDRDFYTGSLSTWQQLPLLGQGEARSQEQELYLVPPCGEGVLGKHLGHLRFLFPGQ